MDNNYINELQLTSYEDYTNVFDALSHPMRIKILGILVKETHYISELARIVNISRPLLYMHIKKLEAAKLIEGHHEISKSGKATKCYRAIDFDVRLTPSLFATLSKEIISPKTE